MNNDIASENDTFEAQNGPANLLLASFITAN